jgi:hypothetical protein
MMLVAACRNEPATEPARRAPADDDALPSLPLAEPPIDRERLLGAVAHAASAAALGEDDHKAQAALDGRPIEIRIRFGCPGNPGEDRTFKTTFDPDKRILSLRASPDLTLDDPIASALAAVSAEAVEGFWIPRPWLLAPGCPKAPPDESEAPPSEGEPGPEAETPAPVEEPRAAAQRVGIAQVFTTSDPRTRRRDHRPYQLTRALGPDELQPPDGFDLVLSGRLKTPGAGRVIACVATDPDKPPDCVVSAEFDRVRIERADNRTVLAEWGS